MDKKSIYQTPVLRVVNLSAGTHLLAASSSSGVEATMSGYKADGNDNDYGFSQD